MSYFVCTQYRTRYVLLNFQTGAVVYTDNYQSAVSLAKDFGCVILKRGLEPFVSNSIVQCRKIWNSSQ